MVCNVKRADLMLELLNEGAITMDDLKDFSDELKEMMKHFSNR